MKNGLPPARVDDRRALPVVETPGAGLARELRGLGLGQRLEPHGDLVRRAAAPPGPVVEQLVPGRDDDEHAAGTVAPSSGDPLDQIEHLRSQRVRVLEEQRHGSLVREPFEQGEEPGPDVVHERGLVAPRRREPEQRLEPIDRVRVGAPNADAADQRAQLPLGDVRARLVVDPRYLAHHRRRRSEGRAVRPEMAPPDEDGSLRIEPGQELGGQPRLPDAGLAEDREQQRARGRDHARERPPEHRELVRPPDEGDRAPRRASAQPLDGERRELLGEPLGIDPPLVAEPHRLVGERARRRADQHLAGRGRALEARGAVDHRPGTSS